MTCESQPNGNLDYISNNNNNDVTTGKVEDVKQNGTHLNGKATITSKAPVEDFETRKSLLVLLTIFATSAVVMAYIYTRFPELEE